MNGGRMALYPPPLAVNDGFWLPPAIPVTVPPKSYDSRAQLRRQDVPSFAPAFGGHFKRKRHKMTNASKLTEFNLRQFTGSENWYWHGINRNVLFTDGAKFVADEGGAYWLLDAIAIAQLYEKNVATEELQVWKLTVREDRTATLVCDDDNDNIVYTQHIEFTDFPLDEIKLYFTDNTILLPSEY
jgi:hypothetical protein